MDQFNNVEHQWQPASPLMMPETITPKKKKEKKPTTVGKIVAICTVFMMITVLLNSVILI